MRIPLTKTQRGLIHRKRKEKKVNGQLLSIELGKGNAYISQLENGRIRNVEVETLEEIAKRLDLSMDEILESVPNKEIVCTGTVGVNKLINRFKEMEKQGALLSGHVNSKDLLIQIIGTIVVVANEDDE